MMRHTDVESKAQHDGNDFRHQLTNVYLSFFAVWFAMAERSGLMGPLLVRGMIPFTASLAFSVAILVFIIELHRDIERLGILVVGFVTCGICLIAQIVCTKKAIVVGYVAGVVLLVLVVFLIIRSCCSKKPGLLILLAAGFFGFITFECTYILFCNNTLLFIISEVIMFIILNVSIITECNQKDMCINRPDEAMSQMKNTARRRGLTAREGEVVALLVRGYPLPAVCRRLGIALRTGETHVKNIYRKLNIHSREELIDLFVRNQKL